MRVLLKATLIVALSIMLTEQTCQRCVLKVRIMRRAIVFPAVCNQQHRISRDWLISTINDSLSGLIKALRDA